MPKVTAFLRRPGEKDLSVYRLQFFTGQGRAGAVGCIRREADNAGTTLRPNGRFVVVSVSAIQDLALRVIYTPQPRSPSHSSVIGLPDDYDEAVMLAVALVSLITPADTYPAV